MDVLAACSLSAAAVAFFGHAAKNSPIDALGTKPIIPGLVGFSVD